MKPLVTFGLEFFNQREFAHEALDGAFAQTYRPLEIIISDDHSTDGTWELIQDYVADYRKHGGGLEVVLNRNDPNVGNILNWQRICELAHGELVVNADGDDVSHSDRVARIVESWEAFGRPSGIVHAGMKTDEKGKSFGVMIKGDGFWGACSAFMRECYERFGPIVNPNSANDEVYAVRARLLNGHRSISDVLVDYRIGGFSQITSDFRKRMGKNFIRSRNSRLQSVLDVAYFKQAGGNPGPIEEYVSRDLRREEDLVVLWNGSSWIRRLVAYHRTGGWTIWRKSGIVTTFLLLPQKWADWCLDLLMCRRKG